MASTESCRWFRNDKSKGGGVKTPGVSRSADVSCLKRIAKKKSSFSSLAGK